MGEGNVVRVGVVGVGGWGNVIAGAVKRSKKTRLVSCFSRNPEHRETFSKNHDCDLETSYNDLVRRNDIDAVLLVTPNSVHAEQAVLAAQYGKHIFIDKPIANTIEDGITIIEACKKADVTLMVGHDMRRLSVYRKAKEFIDSGLIGKPVMVEANYSHDKGFQLTPEKWRWHGDNLGCPGGSLMTSGIHHADTLNYFFGPISTAFSYFTKLYIPADTEDVTATIFKFDCGILGYLGSNYASQKTHWIYIYGTEANLLCTLALYNTDFDNDFKAWSIVDRYTNLKLFAKGKNEAKEVTITEGDPILEEIDEFANCIQTGLTPETDGQGALAALALIRAAIESARTGKQVQVERVNI